MKKSKVLLIIILLLAIISGGIVYYNSKNISSANDSNNVTEVTDGNKNTSSDSTQELNDKDKHIDDAESEEVKNYDTKNLNEYINNDEIVKMGLYADFKQYDDIIDKKQIMEIVKYLRSLKVEKVSQRPSGDTPENSVCFTDKSGKTYSIDFNDDIIAIVFIDNQPITKGEFYKFNGFDPKELRKICENLGLEDSFLKGDY